MFTEYNSNSSWHQPFLCGERLTLRPLVSEDFEPLYLAASDPLIWEQHPKRNRYERSGFELFFKEAIESKGALVVIDNKTKRIIGSSRYYNYDPELSELTIGATFLERQYWGGEYNKEMKQLMIDHAFQFVNTIELIFPPINGHCFTTPRPTFHSRLATCNPELNVSALGCTRSQSIRRLPA